MLRADKILKLLPKVNQSFSVCPLYQKHTFHQLCLNQVCQLVLYENVKSSNLLIVKLWLYAGPLKETLPGDKKTNTENPSFRSPRRDLYSLLSEYR